MRATITMTSKGQFTMPASARKAWKVRAGDELVFTYDPAQKKATITKPLTIEELSARASRYIKPGTKPILNVDEYYQAHRRPRL